MIRATTNGVLNTYRSNLMRSFITLNQARNTVLTQRNFNSYAEDPAGAAQAFQLRRSFLRTDSQISVSESVVRKFESAWSALESIVSDVDNGTTGSAWESVLKAANDPTGAGRNALGSQLTQLADSVVQSLNTQYGDSFIFAGADGLTVPFTWETVGGERTLCYRGVPVDTTDPDQLSQLEYLSSETKYVDIGLGLQEDGTGELIEASAFNASLPGINFLGYGVDNDGAPKNLVSIIQKLGSLLSNCDADGKWASTADGEEYTRLVTKLEAAADNLKIQHVEMDTKTGFLKDNQTRLESDAYTLNEQIMGIEQCDPALAISNFSWAQYCYNAALRMGNSILSQSLMDYLG